MRFVLSMFAGVSEYESHLRLVTCNWGIDI